MPNGKTEVNIMDFIVEVSARHVHLTQEHVELLFGKGHELTFDRPLSQPGQFAAKEKVTVEAIRADVRTAQKSCLKCDFIDNFSHMRRKCLL